jgi:hypothetical protein
MNRDPPCKLKKKTKKKVWTQNRQEKKKNP